MLLIDGTQLGYLIGFQLAKRLNEDSTEEAVCDNYAKSLINIVNKMCRTFKREQAVIACDAKSWRKEVFPEYKANREHGGNNLHKFHFKACSFAHNAINNCSNRHVILVPRAEADDIIGVAVLHKHFDNPIIISTDKDLLQLGVRQHSTITPYSRVARDYNLLQHIISGDSGDGIPNCLSCNDTFVNKSKRQVVMSKSRLYNIINKAESSSLTEVDAPFFGRNKLLIDLKCIPYDIVQSINSALRCIVINKKQSALECFLQR